MRSFSGLRGLGIWGSRFRGVGCRLIGFRFVLGFRPVFAVWVLGVLGDYGVQVFFWWVSALGFRV